MKTSILVHWIGFKAGSSRREKAHFIFGIQNSEFGIRQSLVTSTATRLGFILAALVLVFFQGTPARAAQNFTLESAQQAAAKGNAKALYFLAKAYAKGNGVPQDYVKAADYMRQSAEKGYAFAQNDLGAMYAKGLGVKQDYETSAIWYRQAAENGDSLAQYSLGLIYFQGRGIPKDVRQSLIWYKKAANNKQPDAMLALGDIYRGGDEGVPADRKAALKWFNKAASIGRYEALNSIGFIYEHGGRGVSQNLSLAAKYYLQASEKSDGKGQTNLGRLYKDGTGLGKDRVEAYKWFLLATRHGDRVAERYQMELEGVNPLGKQLLTPEQVSEGRRRADDWDKSHRQQEKQNK